ncbi:MAG: hypothetical protein PHI23_01325 [Candidatus Peribacteraceae bacterium]|nr:hypothetical protein [Candidatus Peribacteraceae bacterium]
MAKNSSTQGIRALIEWFVCLLLFLASVAAFAGVYRVHFDMSGSTFGSTNSSLSLMAFAIAVSLWGKQMASLLRE